MTRQGPFGIWDLELGIWCFVHGLRATLALGNYFVR